MTQHTGHCLCASVKYVISGEVTDAVVCHCEMCQRSSGSAFGANIIVPTVQFQITEGQAQLSCYESSPGMLRYFCRICGSPIYKTRANAPDAVIVRLGTLDVQTGISVAYHIHHEKAAGYISTVIPDRTEVYQGPKA